MDLSGQSITLSFGGNYYEIVIVDGYSLYTWTLFISHKNVSQKLAKIFKNEKVLNIAFIQSDHGGEF